MGLISISRLRRRFGWAHVMVAKKAQRAVKLQYPGIGFGRQPRGISHDPLNRAGADVLHARDILNRKSATGSMERA